MKTAFQRNSIMPMKSQFCILSALALAAGLSVLAQNGETRTGTIPPGQPFLAGGTASGQGAVTQALPPDRVGGGGVAIPVPPRLAPPPPGAGGGGGFGGAGAVVPAPAPSAGASFSSRLQSLIARAGAQPSPPGGPLIILNSEPEPGAAARLREDLDVMALILQKAAGGMGGAGSTGRAMGVDLVFTPGGELKRDLYIEGCGAVFMVKVPFPLVAPGGKTGGGDDEAAADSEWEKAKRELHGLPDSGLPGPALEPYQEEKVTQLKNALYEALKNANNIRDLKPDETATVCIIGPPGSGPLPPPQPMLPARTLRTSADKRLEPAAPILQTESMLIIRARKADIDAFSKGKSDLAAFRNKAKTVLY